MPIICDYHTHTPLCKHASGEPIEYVKRAHEQGLKIIGFSDHCPAPAGFDTECRMDLSRIEEYIGMIEKVKNNPYGIEVLCGMEIDYVPGRMEEVSSLIESRKFDYIIGSVHYVDDCAFDNPEFIHKWNTPERIEYIWNKYGNLLKDMVASFKIDIIGHIDLPKKFGMFPMDMGFFFSELSEVIQLASKKEILIEVNTAGLRKPVKEIYPSLEVQLLVPGANPLAGLPPHHALPGPVQSQLGDLLLRRNAFLVPASGPVVLVQKAIEVRGLKVNVTKIDIPMSFGPAFEGERIRKDYDRWVKVVREARIKVE